MRLFQAAKKFYSLGIALRIEVSSAVSFEEKLRIEIRVKHAWESPSKPERTATGGLSAERQARIAAIDLHFHDLRHEAGSRKLEAGWPLHAVSAFLGHANVTTTARYLNVKDDYLQELIEKRPLTLVKG